MNVSTALKGTHNYIFISVFIYLYSGLLLAYINFCPLLKFKSRFLARHSVDMVSLIFKIFFETKCT